MPYYREYALDVSIEQDVPKFIVFHRQRRLWRPFKMGFVAVTLAIGYFAGFLCFAIMLGFILVQDLEILCWRHVKMGNPPELGSESLIQYLDEVCEWVPPGTTPVLYVTVGLIDRCD
mmetsp:Transcript_16837/g.26268  ORF Transcript_16837/g.26268 Transcript_16837/m.26268 type:complete len:117 (-) Transcript_16837:252-602(-)